MGLTEAKIKDLEDKKFDKLYKKHGSMWKEMVEVATEFTKDNITGGLDPRPDDVLKSLLPTLEVNTELRNHQEDHRARYPRYREYFGDYIIDKYNYKKKEGKKK
ncbi:MAG: hypothetical protein JW902_16905 [Syntrophaceae bacterium]|nr:hypothetical protein [Syntrophaceae bacterium]